MPLDAARRSGRRVPEGPSEVRARSGPAHADGAVSNGRKVSPIDGFRGRDRWHHARSVEGVVAKACGVAVDEAQQHVGLQGPLSKG